MYLAASLHADIAAAHIAILFHHDSLPWHLLLAVPVNTSLHHTETCAKKRCNALPRFALSSIKAMWQRVK